MKSKMLTATQTDWQCYAYTFADGELYFGAKLPKGALPISRFTDKAKVKKWQRMIEGLCRRTYDDTTFLIPGIPEAPDQFVALDALQAFTAIVYAQEEKL